MLVDWSLFVYRISVHASTKHTPFEMMFVHTVCLCESKTESVSNSLTKDILNCMDDYRVTFSTSVEKQSTETPKMN